MRISIQRTSAVEVSLYMCGHTYVYVYMT